MAWVRKTTASDTSRGWSQRALELEWLNITGALVTSRTYEEEKARNRRMGSHVACARED